MFFWKLLQWKFKGIWKRASIYIDIFSFYTFFYFLLLLLIFQLKLLDSKQSQDLWNSGLIYRNSCLEVFCKKGVLWTFVKFTEKHLCFSLFLPRPETLLKKRLEHKCFICEFYTFSQNTFFTKKPPSERFWIFNLRNALKEKKS